MGCQVKHRTYTAMANCLWPKAIWIHGNGQYGLLAHCDVLSVTLWPTLAEAEKAQAELLYCGHACVGRHQIVDVEARHGAPR